jgi:hypothetical protein
MFLPMSSHYPSTSDAPTNPTAHPPSTDDPTTAETPLHSSHNKGTQTPADPRPTSPCSIQTIATYTRTLICIALQVQLLHCRLLIVLLGAVLKGRMSEELKNATEYLDARYEECKNLADLLMPRDANTENGGGEKGESGDGDGQADKEIMIAEFFTSLTPKRGSRANSDASATGIDHA